MLDILEHLWYVVSCWENDVYQVLVITLVKAGPGNIQSCKSLHLLTLCILGNFAYFFLHLLIFKKKTFFQKLLSGIPSVSSGPTFHQAWSESKLFAKVISRPHYQAKYLLIVLAVDWNDKHFF